MSLADIQARMAKEKAAGVKRTYPQHAGNANAQPKALPLLNHANLPCVHIGEDSGPKGWHQCEHPDTPLGDVVCSCKGCGKRCPGYTPAVRSIPPTPPVHPLILESAAFAANIPPYPEGAYTGRGIVIVGGGKYWPSVYVTVRMLRHTGCTLPVQVWYLGEAERDDRYAALLATYGVSCVNLLAHPAASLARGLTGFRDPTKRHGEFHPPFEAKSFAVLHSPYEEVLYLDADNYPCGDVTALFEDHGYQLTGGIYWPDMPQTNDWTRWRDWGVEAFPPPCGWEVGQYLIHKKTAWRQLQMARWYDDHGDWCYGWGAHHDHGDKGPWRVSWARFKTAPSFFSLTAKWESFAFVHPGPDASPLLVHRCRSKIVLNPTGFGSTPQNGYNMRANLPMEAEAFGYLDELRGILK